MNKETFAKILKRDLEDFVGHGSIEDQTFENFLEHLLRFESCTYHPEDGRTGFTKTMIDLQPPGLKTETNFNFGGENR
jgi:hypothetical protein